MIMNNDELTDRIVNEVKERLNEITNAYYEGMCKADETMIPTVREAARNLLLQYDGNIDIERFVDDLIDVISK